MSKAKCKSRICSGIGFVRRIDTVLAGRNQSRKAFAESLGILQGTMATWKTKDILPSADTIVQVAVALNVSVDWLLTGREFCQSSQQNDNGAEAAAMISELESIRDNINLLLSQLKLKSIAKKIAGVEP